MVVIKGTRKIRSIEERKADINAQNAGGEITQPKVDKAFTRQTDSKPQATPMKPLDPVRVSNAMKGLSAPAGSPIQAQSLKEAAEIVNKQREESINQASKVPTVGEFESDITEKVEPPQPLSTAERKTEVEREFAERMKMLEAEPARLTKGQDLADLQKERIRAIEEIEIEEKLITQGIEDEVAQERIAGARKIQEKEGVGLGLALKRYDTRQNAKAKLDPNDSIIFDAIVEQFNSEDFDDANAFNAAISEYHKDGVDADDLKKANEAVAAVFGQNFADIAEDEYLINERGVDRAIIEDNRKLISARKIGETIKSGQAGARVTNSYLKTIMDIDPSLVPDAIGQILASPDASDDAKRQASAFGADFFTDVETGIGQEQEYLTEAKFRAGLGTPEQRQRFIEGTRALNRLNEEISGTPEKQVLDDFLSNHGATFDALKDDKQLQDSFFDGIMRNQTIKKDSFGMRSLISALGRSEDLGMLSESGHVTSRLAQSIGIPENTVTGELNHSENILRNAGYGNRKFAQQFLDNPQVFSSIVNQERKLSRAQELFAKLSDDKQFQQLTKQKTNIEEFINNLAGVPVSDLSDDMLELRTIMDSELINFMKQISGAAISDKEVDRLKRIFPNTSNSAAGFAANFREFKKAFDADMNGVLASREVDGIDKLRQIVNRESASIRDVVEAVRDEKRYGYNSEISIDPETGQITSPEMFKNLSPIEAADLSDEDFAKWEALQSEPEPKQEITGERVTPQQIENTAGNLGINPNHLQAVIGIETAGTFNTSIKNPISGATGLIQFMPATAKGLGTTTDELAQMSPEQQMVFVETYLKRAGVKPGDNLEDVYLSIFFPAAKGKSADYVLQTSTLSPEIIAKQNPGISGGKNYVTVADVKNFANKKAEQFKL